MYLKDTTETLEIDLAGSADPEMHTHISYQDHHLPSGKISYGSQDGVSTDTTEVAILAAPSADYLREVTEVMVFNDDNAAATISIYLDDGGTNKNLIKVVTAAGDLIHWARESGWKVLSSAGYLKLTAHA
jgi:hypothetical protein